MSRPYEGNTFEEGFSGRWSDRSVEDIAEAVVMLGRRIVSSDMCKGLTLCGYWISCLIWRGEIGTEK